MGNRPKDIQNEIAYFYAVVKNMDLNDSIKQSKIRSHEISLDETIYDRFSNLDLNDMDKQLSDTDLFSWIELIENEKLHKAIKSLNIEDQILISYVIKENRSWQELAVTYGISRTNIKNRFNKILRILKILLSKN